MSIHEQAYNLLCTSVERDEWDEAPMFIIEMEEGPGVLGVVADRNGVEFLACVAEGRLSSQLPPGGKVKGLALFSEGWALKLGIEDEDEAEEAMEWCQTHSIADHPAGVEVKTIHSYDGTSVKSFTAYRGEGAPERVVGRQNQSGLLIDGLIAAFNALK